MNKKYFKSLSVRLPLLFVVSMLIIMGGMIPEIYQRFHTRMIDQYTRMAKGATQLMVNAFDGDRVEDYIRYNFDLPEYVNTVDYLYSLRDNYPDMLYMYIYRFEEDGGHVIIDLDADWWEDGEGYEPGYLWSLDEIEEPFKSQLDKVMEGEQITGYSEHSKQDGYLFTYTRPIFDSHGEYACTACVDFSMDKIWAMDREFTFRLSLIMLGIGFIVLLLDFYIVRRSITKPINELSNCAGKFAYDTEEDRKNNIQLLEKLNIHTGDEVEDVYHVLQSVARDSFEATSNLLQTQNELKDSEGMITAMAADYRSLYSVNLDTDESICVRASSKVHEMKEGRVFSFREGFSDYANRFVAEKDREEFLRFVDPGNIREGLSKESMLSLRYLTLEDGVEQYEMLRIAGVRTIEERDDHIVHAIGVGFSDVDRQTREELEQNRTLSEALVRAEEASAAKTAFLNSMSHEIRTPMNAIIGLDTIALKDENLSEATRNELESIGESAKNLLALIDDILDMSHIESGHMELNAAEFSFREMKQQIDTIVGGQCEEKQLHYETKLIGSMDDHFIGDALRIKQIIVNILGNAVKFTDAPGTVTFSAEQKEEKDDSCLLCLTMRDTGVGIDEEFLPRIFEPFSQEDATTTNRYGGSGLGLAITKNMVELMGGSISVESEKDQGTTFCVALPLQRSRHEGNASKHPQEGAAVSLAGLHVLVAEDMAVNANILIMLLEMEKITSEWAENGRLAVEMFANSAPGRFDAILMDLRMPEMDGLTATREIRKLDRPDAKTIPIIALTANAFEEDVRNCLEAGMNEHLAKPMDIELVKDSLRRQLSGIKP